MFVLLTPFHSYRHDLRCWNTIPFDLFFSFTSRQQRQCYTWTHWWVWFMVLIRRSLSCLPWTTSRRVLPYSRVVILQKDTAHYASSLFWYKRTSLWNTESTEHKTGFRTTFKISCKGWGSVGRSVNPSSYDNKRHLYACPCFTWYTRSTDDYSKQCTTRLF